jgi:hypothetical protein
LPLFQDTHLANTACESKMSDTDINLIDQLERWISELEARRDDLIARLPAHSIPPSMIAELDDLEEQLDQARSRLAAQLL